MRSIFSGTHPAQTIDRGNVDNVDKENESGGNRIMETKGLAQKTAKAAKAQETEDAEAADGMEAGKAAAEESREQ